MNANLLQRLIEAGTPAALIAEVAMELAKGQAANDLLEGRRAKDRARKVPRISTETEESAEIHDAPLSRPPNEINSNPPTHTPGIKTRARKGWPVPNGVEPGQWEAFCRQRKKPLSEHAFGLLTGKLAALARDGWPPGEMIDRAIEHGWETVFAPKDHRNGRPRQLPANDGQGRGARTLALLAADDPPEASTGFS
jgi:hypothetical protein